MLLARMARGPRLWEAAATEQAKNDPQWDQTTKPGPEVEFDRRIGWKEKSRQAAARQVLLVPVARKDTAKDFLTRNRQWTEATRVEDTPERCVGFPILSSVAGSVCRKLEYAGDFREHDAETPRAR